MIRIARNWRVLVGGTAAGLAAAVGFTGANASADPVNPVVPVPAPATVTVTVTPDASALTNQATAAIPGEQTAQPAGAASNPAAPVAAPAAVPAAAPVEPITPATAGTITDFLKDKGVTLEPQKAQGFTALNIVLPMPTGWTLVPDPNVPDAFTVIADRQGGDGLYTSNAQLIVYKLVGEFDPREAISHGYVDSQQLFNWQSTDASMTEFGGFPSSIIEGTYRENDLTLNTSHRYVVAQAGTNRYLVSLSVTTGANQVVATADATDAIINGFRVSAPGASPAPAAPAAAATAPAATAPAGGASPAAATAAIAPSAATASAAAASSVPAQQR